MSWLTDRLTKLMEQRDLTVDKIARELAIERSRLKNIVTGSAIPNENLTKRFANYFGEDTEEWPNNVQKREDAKPKITSIPPAFFKVTKISAVPEAEMKVVFKVRVAEATDEHNVYSTA